MLISQIPDHEQAQTQQYPRNQMCGENEKNLSNTRAYATPDLEKDRRPDQS